MPTRSSLALDRADLLLACAFSALLLQAHLLTLLAVHPVQSLILPPLAVGTALPDLSFGVLVIVTWLYGWRAVLYLLPAALTLAAAQPDEPGRALAAAGLLLSGPLAFALLEQMGLDLRRAPALRYNWRLLTLAGLLAAALHGIMRIAALGPLLPPDQAPFLLARTVAGGGLGLLMILISLLLLRRMVMLARS